MPKNVSFAIRVLCSSVLLVLIFSSVDWGEVYALVAGSRLIAVPIIILLVLIERLVAAFRWYQLLSTVDIEVSYFEVVKLTFATSFAGFFLPAGTGTEILRVYGLGRAIDDVPKAFASVAVERVFAIVSLVLLTVLGLVLARDVIPSQIVYACVAGMLILVGGLVAGLNPTLQSILERLVRRVGFERLADTLSRVFDALRMYGSNRRLLLPSLTVAVVFQLLRIVQVVVAGWALHLAIPAWQFFAFMPVIIVLTLLPISVADGLGVREASFVFFFGLAGAEPAAAVGMSLYVYVLSFMTGLPGAYVFARHGFDVRTGGGVPEPVSSGAERSP